MAVVSQGGGVVEWQWQWQWARASVIGVWAVGGGWWVVRGAGGMVVRGWVSG